MGSLICANYRPPLPSTALPNHSDIGQEYDIHHEGVKNGGDGHLFAGKDQRAGGDGDGLRCVLHAHFNQHRPALPEIVLHKVGQKG